MESLISILIKLFIFLMLVILVSTLPWEIETIAVRYTLFPWWTLGLIAINVLIYLGLWVGSLWKGGGFYDYVLVTRGAVPYEILHATDLPPPNALGIPGVYVNILTSMFLHGGVLHLWGNMQFLWLFGPMVETHLNLAFNRRSLPTNRSWKYLLFYLLCGVGAVLIYTLCNRDSRVVLVGASGAISGLLGAHLLKFWRDYRKALVYVLYFFPVRISANLYLVYWIGLQIALQLFYGSLSRVAYMAHIGGFATGLFMSILLPWAGMKTGRFR